MMVSFPTSDNLHRRGIITNDSQFCVAKCDKLELVENLFLDCQFFCSLW